MNQDSGPASPFWPRVLIAASFLVPLAFVGNIFGPYVGLHYAFDWEQLIGGIGRLPAHASVLVGLLLGLLFVLRWPRGAGSRREQLSWVAPVVGAWFVCALTGFIVFAWTRDGVPL